MIYDTHTKAGKLVGDEENNLPPPLHLGGGIIKFDKSVQDHSEIILSGCPVNSVVCGNTHSLDEVGEDDVRPDRDRDLLSCSARLSAAL